MVVPLDAAEAVVTSTPRTKIGAAERIYRARRIGTTFGRVYLGVRANRFIARRLNPRDMEKRWARFNLASAESIYDTAIELRGLILKGCQFLGSRADVLPRQYVQVLSRLQDRVPPRSFAVVRDCVERELGRSLADAFTSFSKRPIASASLAQVHEATLHSGERVAVKVQYPEIEALVRSDLANLRVLFRTIDVLERDFDVLPLIDELATYVPRELDFLNEGHNAETIARFLAHRDDVVIPRIHWEFTTRRVLVMEFMDGTKITDTNRLRGEGIDLTQVARSLVEVFCEQILVRGFFHADPHPGNILVQKSETGAPRLALLDFGLAKELPPRFKNGIVRFATALLQGDVEIMAEALVDLGFETRDGSPESLGEIARFVLDAAIQVRQQSFLDRDLAQRIGSEISDRIRANPIVRIPSHVVLLGRVIGLLSGVSRTLEAPIDLVQTILPYAMGAQSPVRPGPKDAPEG
jgi:predicted unusual protein kinase regulating ubiquinone biosynthesis (AarF/ABC1/UbiB family)